MIAYQNGVAKIFGVEAAGYKDDDEYQVAHWFKVNATCRLNLLTNIVS
jgi:hypothetical protein